MEHRTKIPEAGFYSHFLTHCITLKSQILGLSCLIAEQLVRCKSHPKIKISVVFRMAKYFSDIYSAPNLVLNLRLRGQIYFFPMPNVLLHSKESDSMLCNSNQKERGFPQHRLLNWVVALTLKKTRLEEMKRCFNIVYYLLLKSESTRKPKK